MINQPTYLTYITYLTYLTYLTIRRHLLSLASCYSMPLMKPSLTIIGVGNMGSAFAYGLLIPQPGMAAPQKNKSTKNIDGERPFPGAEQNDTIIQLHLCDGNNEKLKQFPKAKHFTDPKKAIAKSSTVLLAVKPQSARELLQDLSPLLKDKLVISIMAGISIKTLGKLTGSKRIVRAMPNLPATVGLGCTGWCATKAITAADHTMIETIFAAVGTQIELMDESKLDAVTAISGSGPAYFFLLAELLGMKALEEGFTAQQAAVLARATLIGSGVLVANDKRTLTALREAVTSKGGTTEAALASFSANQLDTLINEAVDAAIIRCRKLNQ